MVDRGEDQAAADAAFVLEPGVPYARRWAHAQDAAVVLRAELHRLGLVELADQVRAEVNVYGVGVVVLGSISPQTGHALAALLAAIRAGAGTDNGRSAGPPRPRSLRDDSTSAADRPLGGLTALDG